MPQVVAPLIGLVKQIGFLAASGGITGFVVKGALYLGGAYVLTAVSQALQKKPDFSDFQSEAVRRLSSSKGASAPRRVIYGKQRVGGHLVYVESHGADNKYLNTVWAFAGHECEAIDEIHLDDTVLTFKVGDSGDVSNTDLYYPDTTDSLVFANKHLGTATQTVDSDLDGVSSNWTTNHRLRGICYVYLRLHFEPERMNQIPNVTAIIRGKNDIYDFRDASTGYSTNAALCVANYMMDASLGLGIAQADIDDTTIQASANVCDESVNLNPSGTESRYTINGTFETSVSPKQILEKMLTSMAGTLVDPGGTWYIHAGAYTAPTVTLTESHLRAGFQVQTKPSKSDNCNAVRGIYSNPEANYQPDDFPPVTNSTYETEDGEQIWRDIDLPFTTSSATAQRLAKIELERTRQAIQVVFPANMHGYQVQEGDTVALTIARMGWTAKVFDVLEAPLVIEESEGGAIFGTDLLLKETASTVFDWNSGEETEVDPAPNTNLPDPGSVVPPTSLAVTSGTDELIQKADGTIISRVKLAWTRPLVGFAQRIQVEYKKSADSTWIKLAQIPFNENQYWISDVEDGTNYDFRVASVNGIGVLSTYETVSGHTIVGKTAAPSAVSGLTVTPIPGGLKMTWTQVADQDMWYYSVEIDDNASFTSPDENLVGLVDTYVELDLPETLHYVRIRSFDTSGNYSAWSSTVSDTPLPVGAGQAIQHATIYKLNDSTVGSPTAGTYANPLSGQEAGWSLSVPSLVADGDVIYASNRTFTDDGLAPQDASWSTPTIYGQRADGKTGDKVATGFVYFQTLQSGAPSSPSATSYNFTSGAFTGLTANWGEAQPSIAVTDTTVSEWRSAFTVSENYLGAQTINFGTPSGAVQVTADLESDNYDNTPGSEAGWKLERLTGDLYANNGFFRGEVEITDGNTTSEIRPGTVQFGSNDQRSSFPYDPLCRYYMDISSGVSSTNVTHYTTAYSPDDSKNGRVQITANANNSLGKANLIISGDGGDVFSMATDGNFVSGRPFYVTDGLAFGTTQASIVPDANGGVFKLNNDLGSTRIQAYVDTSDRGNIVLYDEANKASFHAYCDAEGGRIDIYDDSTTPAIKVKQYVSSGGGRGLYYDSGGTLRIDLNSETGSGVATIAGSNYRSYASGDTDITGLIGGATSGTLIEGSANGHIVIGIRGNGTGDSFAIIKDETNSTGLGSYDTRLFEIDSTNADFETELRVQNHSLWIYNGSSVNTAKVDTNGWFWSIDSNGYRAVMDPLNGFRVFNTSQVFQGGIDITGHAVFTTLNLSNLPTSSAGLSSGDVWSNSGVLTIV